MSTNEKPCEKGKDPKCCSPEQIRTCHGEVAEHECESEERKEQVQRSEG